MQFRQAQGTGKKEPLPELVEGKFEVLYDFLFSMIEAPLCPHIPIKLFQITSEGLSIHQWRGF